MTVFSYGQGTVTGESLAISQGTRLEGLTISQLQP